MLVLTGCQALVGVCTCALKPAALKGLSVLLAIINSKAYTTVSACFLANAVCGIMA